MKLDENFENYSASKSTFSLALKRSLTSTLRFMLNSAHLYENIVRRYSIPLNSAAVTPANISRAPSPSPMGSSANLSVRNLNVTENRDGNGKSSLSTERTPLLENGVGSTLKMDDDDRVDKDFRKMEFWLRVQLLQVRRE
jgi:hypothetical protein